jgi:hypothetical protein
MSSRTRHRGLDRGDPGDTGRVALLLLAALVLAACGGSGGGGGFVVRSTTVAVADDTPVVVRGRWVAFLADEATTGPGGSDLNGDGDRVDSVATVLDLSANDEISLEVAAREVHVVDGHVYVVVEEAADGRDWNGDGLADDVVLLHWSKADGGPAWVDDVDPDVPVAGVECVARFYYSSADPPGGATTTLRLLESQDPRTPVPLASVDGLPLAPRLIRIESALLFLYLDETVEGIDLNGDGDPVDPYVLALLDGTAAAPLAANTGLALAGPDAPTRAKPIGESDWIVAFLVHEGAHSDLTGGGFNDPRNFDPEWFPPQCQGTWDDDLDDDVLHFLRFADWMTDPLASPPVNAGLAGRGRVAVTADHVATITPEWQEGGCDLNVDGDLNDRVVRWLPATEPSRPFVEATQLYALWDATRGGVRGLAEVDEVFAVVVDEESQREDIDGDGRQASRLVAWMDPSQGLAASWTFESERGSEVFFVGSDWMGESPGRDRLLSSFREIVYGGPINPGDTDSLDAVPSWASLDASAPALSFVWAPAAVQPANAGIVVSGKQAFFRIDELADGTDWNLDGDRDDEVLLRADLSSGRERYLAVLNELEGASVALGDPDGIAPEVGAAFLTDERMAGEDLNGDGDTEDFVLQHFKF